MSTCILTVGSTSFPALVAAGLSEQAVRALEQRGVTTFIVQYGKGSSIVDMKARLSSTTIDIQLHPFLGDIEARIQRASIVISHAGAGSILAAVRNHRNPQLIVVPNETLMDNHQAELAAELRAKKWAVVAEAEAGSLAAAIDSLSDDPAKSATAFPAFDPKRFPAIINAHMGYK